MKKGVIFDLDGVLVSTDELHYKAWKKLAEELDILDYTKEDNIKQKGVSRMDSLEVILAKGKKTYTLDEKNDLAERKNNYYKELLASLDDNAVLKDVTKALTMLRNRGVLIAVGSVSKNAIEIIKRTGLTKYINRISSGLDITKSKPDPEVFLVAAKKLGLLPEECLVVEDSLAGVIAAKAAGMSSLAVGEDRNKLNADYMSETLLSETNWDVMLAH